MSSVRNGEFLPMTETSFFILLALREPMHGYAVMQYVREVSGGRVWIAAGTMYGALDNLCRQKLISPLDGGSSRRKQYVISPLGTEVLRRECERLRMLVELCGDVTPERGAI